ncbi:hypothetical protein [Marinimicrobium alkaliphilum]|uniref:hypothetical protein n=1 Tax=Marinimicrobium alkaliphilum TaxID=2202654 RepID=UPI001300B8A0|nr:hypothetical protein [Marinimicrobium alkaliphilum]
MDTKIKPRRPVQSIGLLASGLDADTRLQLACEGLQASYWHWGSGADAEYVYRLVSDNPEWLAQASAPVRSRWACLASLWPVLFGAPPERRADAEAETEAQDWVGAVALLVRAVCASEGAALERTLPSLTRVLGEPPPLGEALISHFLAARALFAGHLSQALDHTRRALAVLPEHPDGRFRAVLRAHHARLLARAGYWRQALSEASRARREGRGFANPLFDFQLHMMLACLPLQRNQLRRCLPYVRRAFAAGAREGLIFSYLIDDDDLAQFCALALREEIEPDYTRTLIRQRQLTGPTRSDLQMVWPWPCRLWVLGRFDVEVSGERLGRLSQPQLRALLSELVLAGPQGMPQVQLASRLWPDSAPDKALNCLHVTIHRARDFLQVPDAIAVDGGLVTLVAEHLWVDAWALTELAVQRKHLSLPVLRQAVDLFRGQAQFVAADELQAEIYQESLNVAFRDLVLSLGDALVRRDVDDAVSCYRHAQRFLPLDERLWAGRLETEALLDNPRMLALSFRQLEKAYQRDLDMLPPSRLLSVYKTLRGD